MKSKLRGKSLRAYKETLGLSKDQKSLIIGSALGDGSLRIPGRNKEANLIVDHGEDQKDYVLWKYNFFRKWVLTPPKEVKRRYHKDISRNTISWRFLTISHPLITDLYYLFYPQGKKVVPESINDLLVDPLSLAVWIMDDGTKSGDSFFLSSQSFNLREQRKLLCCLEENFGLKGTINVHSQSKGKTLYRIRISAESLDRMCDLVKPYILPSLSYKVSF